MLEMNDVLETLGYSESTSLLRNFDEVSQSNHFLKKIFDELSPTAIYLVENNPQIAFFDLSTNKIPVQLVKKIWNAQIPIAIFNFDNRIEIFNGCHLDKNKKLLLLDTIGHEVINSNSIFSIWNITGHNFWLKYEKKLSKHKLYTTMLENIKIATSRLKEIKLFKESACSDFAVKIILRLIFIRYLIDRGVDLGTLGLNGNVETSQANLLKIIKNKDKVYELFLYLKDKFNGNIFDLYQKENISEYDLLNDEALGILHDLMSGNINLSTHQLALFPLYDFNIIPIELISNIYEKVLGYDKQQEDKAFYTPQYLAHYVLEQTIKDFLNVNYSCRVLDPACGSGIFLVETARRIIESNFARKDSGFNDKKLIECVTNNIIGVDKNPEAIDVAIFSLYITMLDYKDPKTLVDFKLPLLKDINFFACDFFSSHLNNLLSGKQFDFIIGNPPWGNLTGAHIAYCKDKELIIHENEIARSFIYRTKDFSSPNTKCCLIVTSKLFYNTKEPSIKFRKWLLENTKIDRYIELAEVRELVFEGASGPAGIISYQFTNDKNLAISNEMLHLTLRRNIFFELFNIIVTEKNDYKYVQQKFLIEHDWAWKVLVFGTSYDFNLIKKLKNKYSTIKKIVKEYKLTHGTGIQTNTGDMQDATGLKGRKLIDAKKGISAFCVDLKFSILFDKDKIHRTRENNRGLFNPPYVLFKKGIDGDTYKCRAVYSEESFLYPDAVTGICGNADNKKLLLSLTGILNSSVYSYFNLMLGSSIGIERQQIYPTELFKYPAIIDNDIANLTETIQEAVVSEKEIFSNAIASSKNLIRKLDKLVAEKFGLLDNHFFDYAINIQLPRITKNNLSWEKVSFEQMCNYVKVLTDYFTKISSKYVVIKIYQDVACHYCAVELVFQDIKPECNIIKSDMAEHVKIVSKLMNHKINDMFYQIKDVVYFDEDSFYIIKSDEYKNWHPAMAQLDLSDIIDSILSREDEVNI